MAPANIVFMSDDRPGFSRRRRGRGWSYHAPDGTHVGDEGVVARLNGIAMPPAYTKCWFSPLANGHLQATGFDARLRKQYRYHTDYRAFREERKFGRLAEFGAGLPDMRSRVAEDLRKRTPCKTRALAAIVRLLDCGLLRIGTDRYAEENGSYGASTLQLDHAAAAGRRLKLHYRAKSGKDRELTVCDAGLLRFVRDMQDLPGQRLFKYLDEEGGLHEVHSHDVNDYIRAELGEGFSAKDFRTFGASALAYGALAGADKPLTVKALTETVAAELGNTPAIARKSYIHPDLIALCGRGPDNLSELLPLPRRTQWLNREERGLIAFFG